jgi:hypothetical protein
MRANDVKKDEKFIDKNGLRFFARIDEVKFGKPSTNTEPKEGSSDSFKKAFDNYLGDAENEQI